MPPTRETAFERDFAPVLRSDAIKTDFAQGQIMHKFQTTRLDADVGEVLMQHKSKAMRRAAKGDVDGVARAREGVLAVVRRVFTGEGGFNGILCDAQKKKIEQLEKDMQSAEARHSEAITVQANEYADAQRAADTEYNRRAELVNIQLARLEADIGTSNGIINRQRASLDLLNADKITIGGDNQRLSVNLNIARSDVEKARQDLAEARRVLKQELEQEAKNSASTIQQLREGHRKLTQDHAATLTQLRSDINNAKEQARSASDTVVLLRQGNEKLTLQLAQKDGKVAELAREKDHTRKEADRLQNESTDRLVHLYTLEARLASVSRNGRARLEDVKQSEAKMLQEIHDTLLELAQTREEKHLARRQAESHRRERDVAVNETMIYRVQSARHKNHLKTQTTHLEVEKCQHTTTKAKLDEEMTSHMSTKSKFEEEMTSHGNTKHELKSEQSSHSTTKARLDEETTSHVTTKGKLEEEVISHGNTKHELKSEQSSHGITKGKLDEETISHGITKGKFEEEVISHGNTKHELKSEQSSHGTTKGKLDEETISHSITKRDSRQEKSSHGITKRKLHEETTSHGTTKRDFEQEKGSHDITKRNFEQEKGFHGITKRKFDQEKSSHEITKRNFEQEQSSHGITKGKLDEETTSHGTTTRDLKQEKSSHGITKRDFEQEKSSHGITKRNFEQEKNSHGITKNDLAKERRSHSITTQHLAARDNAIATEIRSHNSTKLDVIAQSVEHSTEKASHAGTKAELQVTAKQLRACNGQFTREKDAHHATKTTLRAIRLNLQTHAGELANEKASHAATAADLQTRGQELENEEISHQTTKTSLVTVGGYLNTRNAELARESSAHAETTASLSARNNELSIERTAHNTTKGDLASRTAELSMERSSLEGTKRQLRNTHNLVISERIGRQSERSSAARVIRGKDATIAINNVKHKLVQDRSVKEYQALQERLHHLEAKCEELGSSRGDLEYENDQLDGKLANTLSELGDVKKRLESAESTNSTKSRAYEDLQHENQLLKDIRTGDLTKMANQSGSIERLQQEIVRLLSVETFLRDTGNRSDNALRETRESLDTARDQLTAATGQAQCYRNALSVQAGQIASTKHRIDNVRSQRDVARSNFAHIKSKLEASRGMATELQRQVVECETAKTTLEGMVNDQLQELAAARKRQGVGDSEYKKLEAKFTKSQEWLVIACNDLDAVQQEAAAYMKRKTKEPHGAARGAKRRR